MMVKSLKQSRFWAFAIAVLVAAQLALALHSFEHRFNPDVFKADECALCQVASTMAAGPASVAISLPNFEFFVRELGFVAQATRPVIHPAGFSSRAPPLSVSI
jgi:hypothetical protein